jgi:Uma2 family endonuclease
MRATPDGPARQPDLLFVAREHLDRLTETRLSGPADFVVEVVSDDSVARDRADKFYEYQAARMIDAP